jgi:hypothetical protein
MSLNDTIESLANATVYIERYDADGYDADAGAYTKGAMTLLGPFNAVVQPAYNMNRVIGGADIEATATNQRSDEVFVMYIVSEVRTREDSKAPDIARYQRKKNPWPEAKRCTIERHEADWGFSDEEDAVHSRVIMAKITGGGS